jgi:hypothetical protein
MVNFPPVEQQVSGIALREAKEKAAQAKAALESLQALLQRAQEALTQRKFFETKIDAARGSIFDLLVQEFRRQEQAHAEEYAKAADDTIAELSLQEKREEP